MSIEITPRAYQMELFEQAKNENTIVVLDTGGGKARLVIRHVLDSTEAIDDHLKLVFVLVPTVTLVIQQAEYLKNHFPFRVQEFYGAMGIDLWDKEKWSKELSNIDALVLTPMILVSMLQSGYISWKDICLIVFDECHHARKAHPYSQLMSLYRQSNAKTRILGLTASPLNNKTEVRTAIQVLEHNLNCKSFSAKLADREEIEKYLPTRREEIVRYNDSTIRGPRAIIQENIPIWTRFEIDSSIEGFETFIKRKYQEVGENLGWWAADVFFLQLLEYMRKVSASNNCFEMDFLLDMDDSQYDNDFNAWLKNVVEHKIDTLKDSLEADRHRLATESPKIQKLVEILQTYMFKEDFRGIVFVQKRSDCFLLAQIIKDHPELQHIRCDYLTGQSIGKKSMKRQKTSHLDRSNSDSLYLNCSMQVSKQKETVKKFRNGDLNLLIATSVAEEGLDIQACMLVVRFDICQTVTNYIQSKGRARHETSRFIFLIGENEFEAEHAISDLRYQESQMKNALVGEKRDFSIGLGRGTRKELSRKDIYNVESTGSFVTVHSSIACLNKYCQVLPRDEYFDTSPEFRVVGSESNCYVAHIFLPIMVPESCRSVIGYPEMSKQAAKASAALCAIKKLHMFGELTDRLVPTVKESIQLDAPSMEMVNQVDENLKEFLTKRKGSNLYRIGIPSKFTSLKSKTVGFLHQITIKTFDANQALRFGFISANPIHQDYFRIKVDHLDTFDIIATFTMVQVLTLDSEFISKCTKFHQTLISTVLRHPKLHQVQDWAYLLVPISNSLLDTAQLDFSVGCSSQDLLPQNTFGTTFKIGSIIQDRVYYNRAYEIVKVLDNWNPFTLLNPDSIKDLETIIHSIDPDGKLESGFLKFPSVAAFYKHRLKFADSILADQSLILARKVRYPELSSSFIKISRTAFILLLPQTCYLTGLTDSDFCDFMNLPVILRHLEYSMLAKEVQCSLGLENEMSFDFFSTALTSRSARLKRDYETFETVGDSFLKMYQALHLFSTQPTWNEGRLSMGRSRIENNTFLRKCAYMANIHSKIHVGVFDRRVWLPCHFDTFTSISSVKRNKEHELFFKKRISNKAIADTVEAILGTCCVCIEDPETFEPERLASLVCNQLLSDEFKSDWTFYLDQVHEHYSKYKLPSKLHSLTSLEKIIGYEFKNKYLLAESLTHPSYSFNNWVKDCYQRLEFLGDALFGYILTRWIYKKYRNVSVGDFTVYRSKWVCNRFLAAVASKIGLQKFIYSGSANLNRDCMRYSEIMNERYNQCKGIPRDYWNDDAAKLPCPKSIADVYEALIGAMFIDCGFDVRFMENYINKTVIDDWASFVGPPDTDFIHPVNKLIMYVAENFGCKDLNFFVSTDSEMFSCAISCHGNLIASSTAKTKAKCRANSSNQAIQILREKGLSGCFCRTLM